MSSTPTTASKAFDAADQERFARLSGDSNPMHMDAIAARRTQAAAPVVHGVHAALWALDALWAGQPGGGLCGLKVRFDRFIYLGDVVQAVAAQTNDTTIEIALSVGEARAALITLSLGTRPAVQAIWEARPSPPLTSPLDRSLDQLAGSAGSFGFPGDDDAVKAAFPTLVEALGSDTVHGLMALSTLIGMHAPGLHSIFSKLSVGFAQDETIKRQLDYQVSKVQPLFRMITIAVRGPGFDGTVDGFIRQPPVIQPSMADLRAYVAHNAFAGARALIVGGSRGIGEFTAKLLASGGGEVVLTYATGAKDAHTVADAITAGGGRCRVLSLDINYALTTQLPADLGPISHLYYFATPPIFRQKSVVFSDSLFEDFNQTYVTAFYDLCQTVLRQGTPLRVFYPSSVAVSEGVKDAVEYVMAKTAGEVLCAEMNRRLPGLEIVVERLPRLSTDQTATVLPTKSAPILETLLPIIQRMHRKADE